MFTNARHIAVRHMIDFDFEIDRLGKAAVTLE